LFDSLSKSLIEVLTEEAQNNGTKIAYAQLVGGLAKVIPQRIGGLLPAVMPGILSLTMVTGDEEALESGLTVGNSWQLPETRRAKFQPVG
jgi:hypothetical protein